MFQPFKEKDFAYPFLIWIIVVFWYLILVYNFFELAQYKVQDFFASQSFYIFSRQPEQAKDIVIVAIDEASRRDLNLKWPWPRSVTAQLIRRVASFSPKIIGLDMVFSGESALAEDDVLADVFRAYPNIIAGYKLGEKTAEFPLQKYLQAAKAVGFVDKPLQASKVWKTRRSVDEVIRSLRTYYMDEDGYNFSIDVELAAAYLDVPRREIRVYPQKGINLGKDVFIPSRGGVTPINYLLHYNEFAGIGASLVLNKEIDPQLFKDKVVLIGATDPLIHDEYLTPLGVLPGVSILSNALLTMLSGRFIHNLTGLQTLAIILILGLLILFINKKTGLAVSSVLTFLILGGTFIGGLYLRAQDIQFDYFSVFFLTFVAFIASNLYKYSYISYMSGKLRSLAITDPLTGFYNGRYFLLKLDEEMRNASRGVMMFGLTMVNYRKLSVELAFDELKSLVKSLAEYLERNLIRGFERRDLVRVSPDTLGIAVWNAKKADTEAFFKELLGRMNKLEWKAGDKTPAVFLKGALIYKDKKVRAQGRQIIYHLTALLKKAQAEGKGLETMELGEDELWKGKREPGSEDTLDFLTTDLNERNKELEQTLRELAESKQETEEAYFEVICSLVRALEEKDSFTQGHSERVATYAKGIALQCGFNDEGAERIYKAALLHDIGKIGLPERLLHKKGKLSSEEIDMIKKHELISVEILKPIKVFKDLFPIILHHHERYDGTGYPYGLSAEMIPIGAQILAVADAYDAITSGRGYKKGRSRAVAVSELEEHSKKQFNPVYVEALKKVLKV